MNQATKRAVGLGLAALISAAVAPAQADKPEPPEKSEKPGKASATEHAPPGNASAHPPGGPARARGERGGAADEAHGQPGDSGAAREAAPGQIEKRHEGAEPSGEPGAAAEAKEKQHKETRAKRQEEGREQLRRRYGLPLLERAPVQAELKTHAWRVARLERLKTVASGIEDADKRKATLERLEKLSGKEEQRHERHMATLSREKGAGQAAGSAEAPQGSETQGENR